MVVVGGGVGGCAIAYWLTKLGERDVLLLERADLTSGSTFHSAGLVGQLRSSLSLTKMMMNSVELYALESEGSSPPAGVRWDRSGSLPRRNGWRSSRQADRAKTFGLPLELSRQKRRTAVPPMTTAGVLGAAFLPTDGYIDPSQLVCARRGARRGGAEIATNTRVNGFDVGAAASPQSRPTPAVIEAEIVVNAGGMFARNSALSPGERPDRADGARVPRDAACRPAARNADDARPVTTSSTSDPRSRGTDRRLRARPRAVVARRHPGGLQRQAARRGWPRFEPLLENAVQRVPGLAEMESVRLINGPEAFTDNEFILGPTDVRGFWVAAGFCAHGLAGAVEWGSSSPSGSSTACRASTSGRWTLDASARPTAAAVARAHGRGLLDLLRRPLPRP